jgi:GT2 family glycosyltransferase
MVSDTVFMKKSSSSDILPSILIIVINWNGKKLILDCLESLEKQDYPREKYQILVVDNGSSDGSQAAIKKKYSDIDVLQNSTNLGYVKAVNQGIQHGLELNVDFMWILNNDVLARHDALRRLVEVGRQEQGAGVLAPVIYSATEPEKVENAGYRINYWTGRLKKLRLEIDVFPSKTINVRDVDSNMGCANLIKTSVFQQIGLFNPIYEIYFEETDFNVRARKGGYRVVVVRDAKVVHKTASTMNRHLLRRALLLLRNLCIFELYHAKPLQLLVFFPYFLFVHIPSFLVRGGFFAYKLKRQDDPI